MLNENNFDLFYSSLLFVANINIFHQFYFFDKTTSHCTVWPQAWNKIPFDSPSTVFLLIAVKSHTERKTKRLEISPKHTFPCCLVAEKIESQKIWNPKRNRKLRRRCGGFSRNRTWTK